VLATLGAAAMWSHGHHWYPVALVISSLPSAWLGATLAQAPRAARVAVS
jgi:hypothetical protein